ncbi:MAG TPA: DMT family transporter [Candidatus Saccharimonadales bacterium]|nr:DMT family transporter [Candidatus Saccharimonadales bacterium]
MILIILLYAVFSAMTFINSALMAENPYPFFVGMLRALGSSIILLSYSWIFFRNETKNFTLSKRGWKLLLTYGILIHAFVMCGFSYSVQYADPVSICFIVASGPFLTAIIQYFTKEEFLTHKKMIGLVVGFLGLLPILMISQHTDAIGLKNPGLVWWGNLVAFLSMIVFCYGWIVLKQFLKEFSQPIQLINGIAMLFGGLVSAIFVIMAHGYDLFSLKFSSDFPMLMMAFLLSSLFTYMLYVYLLKRYSPTFISFAGFLEPAFGLLYAAVFMGYGITQEALIALAILFIGLYIFYLEELKTISTF